MKPMKRLTTAGIRIAWILAAASLWAGPVRAVDPASEAPAPADAPQAAAPRPLQAEPDAAVVPGAAVVERVEIPLPDAPEMDPERMSLTLTDTELLHVVELFIRVSGANIIASPTDLTGRVTVSLRDKDWRSALASILELHNLALVETVPDSNVYTILPRPPDAPEPMFMENFHLNFVRAETLSDAAKLLLEPSGRVLLAQGSRLSVLGTAQRVRDVRRLVEEMDRRVPQVVVESKFVELNEQAIKDLGINWQVLEGFTATLSQPRFGIDREETRRRMDQDARVYQSNQTFSRQAESGWRLDRQTPIPPGPATGTEQDFGEGRSFRTQGDGQFHLHGRNFSEFEDGAITMVPPFEMREMRALSAVLSASDLALTLSALRQNTGADIISNPKIIVSSGESATIHVGERRPNIVRKIQSTAGGTSEAIYEFGDPQWIDIGVKVTVTPTVNTESNITLRIIPQLDRQIGILEPTPGLTFPILVTRRIESEFALESGKTVAIGGLTQTTDREVVRKIPFLGDIPIIGRYFFSHTHTERRQDEVIIFVTLALADSESLQYASGIPSQGRLISDRFTDPQAPQLQLRRRGARDADPPAPAE